MLLVTAFGVIVAVVGVYFAYQQPKYVSDPGPSPSSTAATGPSPTTTAEASVGGIGAPTTLCGSPGTGESMDCYAEGAALRVAVTPCDWTQVLRAWGLDTSLDALDLMVSSDPGACWVAPGSVASQAGARASDLVTASQGTVPDVLRQCARADGLPAASCAEPHEVEWIGPWQTKSPEDDLSELCRERAVQYTRMTLSGTENRLVTTFAERTAGSSRQIRCLVRVEAVTLEGSLRDLRNGDLPVAP